MIKMKQPRKGRPMIPNNLRKHSSSLRRRFNSKEKTLTKLWIRTQQGKTLTKIWYEGIKLALRSISYTFLMILLFGCSIYNF